MRLFQLLFITLLLFACSDGNKETAAQESKDSLITTNNTNTAMYTFEKFYHVVEIGDIDSAKIICNAQPDLIKGKDKYGFSILHGAVMDDKEELINFLIEKGAEVNAKNDEGITPLHIVLYPEIAEILIKKGALVNCISDNGNTPLHSMAENGDESLDEVKILLKNGADKTLKNKSGETAYDIAKGREDKEMMKLLKP